MAIQGKLETPGGDGDWWQHQIEGIIGAIPQDDLAAGIDLVNAVFQAGVMQLPKDVSVMILQNMVYTLIAEEARHEH